MTNLAKYTTPAKFITDLDFSMAIWGVEAENKRS